MAYNTSYNDLEGYGLAYGIAFLLSNLCGKYKGPLLAETYPNLSKFIILHQIGFGYVALLCSC